MERAWKISIPDQRAENPNGRMINAISEELQVVCEQHQYESFILPLAVHYKWPRSVNFEKVLERCYSKDLWAKLIKVYQNPWSAISIARSSTDEESQVCFDLSKATFRYEQSISAG
jgi:hypothetical protein